MKRACIIPETDSAAMHRVRDSKRRKYIDNEEIVFAITDTDSGVQIEDKMRCFHISVRKQCISRKGD